MIRKGIVSLILCVVLVSSGVYMYLKMTSNVESPQRGMKRRGGFPVDVVQLESKTIRDTLRGFGTARALREAEMSNQVAGQIVEICGGLRVGSEVDEGQLLVRIDPTDYEQALHRAEAMLAQAKADATRVEVERKNINSKKVVAQSELETSDAEFERIRQLVEQKVVADTDLDSQRLRRQIYERALLDLERQLAMCVPQDLAAEALVKSREADLERAQVDLERTRILAPFTGVVGAMNVEVGELVRANELLLSLVDLSRLEIPVELAGSRINAIKPGAKARIYLETGDEPVAEAHVVRVAPQINLASRTFQAFLVVDAPDEGNNALQPGLFVKAEIDGPEYEGALSVPRSLFVGDNVYIVQEGLASMRKPTIAGIVGNDYLITGGLEAGQMVIASSLEMMFEGRPVSPVGSEGVVAGEAPGPPGGGPGMVRPGGEGGGPGEGGPGSPGQAQAAEGGPNERQPGAPDAVPSGARQAARGERTPTDIKSNGG